MIKVSEYSVNSDATEESDDRLLSLLGELPMPRKKSTGPKPMLTVFVSAYASEEIRERIERGGVFTDLDEVVTSVAYLGTSKSAAGSALYRV